MTMQRVANYGSFLQAYALKKYLEEMGNEVIFVDFMKTEIMQEEPRRKHIPRVQTILKLLSPKKRKMLLCSKQINKRFNNEFIPQLGINNNSYGAQCDILIIGSDQVFSCATIHNKDGEYYKELFGYNANTNRIISYAASFGSTTLDFIEKKGMEVELKKLLSKFEAISVRDQNSKYMIEKLMNKTPYIHLDPVLIYDFKKEVEKEVEYSNYLLLYAYGNRFSIEEGKEIRRFAKKKNLKIMCIYGMYDWCDLHIVPTPFEALAIFKKADYVVTDTFHGTVISIKYNKKFVTFVRKRVNVGEDNKNKLGDLLSRFDLEERSMEQLSELEEKLEKDIDYRQVNKTIQDCQLETRKYLGQYCKMLDVKG